MAIRIIQIRYTTSTTGAEVVDVDAVEALEEGEEDFSTAEEEEEIAEDGTAMGKVEDSNL